MKKLDVSNYSPKPEWMNDEALKTLSRGYLQPGETPKDMHLRLAYTAAKILNRPDLQQDIFDILYKGWLGPATPVATNFGADTKSYPISCLETGTKIHTKEGFTEIQDLKEGDLVLTHLGNWRPVKKIWSRQTTDDLYKLSVAKRGKYSLNITGNHPVLTNKGWVPVENLKKKHKIVVEPLCHTFRKEKVKRFDFNIESKRYNKGSSQLVNSGSYKCREIPNATLSKELAWWFGLWFAEGHTNDNGTIGITMNSTEEEQLLKWGEIATNIFGLPFTYKQVEDNRGNTYAYCHIYNKYLQTWFDKEFGKGCKVKLIPEWLYTERVTIIRSFVEGFILGDGSVDKGGGNKIDLANEKLVYQLWYLNTIIDNYPSLNYFETNYKEGHYSYNLFLPKTKVSNHLSPVFELEKQDRNTTVWDIEVEDDHSFIAQGVVVHNCFSVHLGDSIESIYDHLKETAKMTQRGGGVGIYGGDLRSGNSPISNGGISSNKIQWFKLYDQTASAVSQGSIRRGAFAYYFKLNDPDAMAILRAKDHLQGDPRSMLDGNIGVIVTDEDIRKLEEGSDPKLKEVWDKCLEMNLKCGSPYFVFIDNINRQNPEAYKIHNLEVSVSNLCSEITLFTDDEHSFVCCLSSLNLAKWFEWKDWIGTSGKTVPELAIYFLDAIMSEFIKKAGKTKDMARAVKFAKKSRALGLGTMGLHFLYQKEGLPFKSKRSRELNIETHKFIREMADKASAQMAEEYGQPEWCVGTPYRHTHKLAIAPTTSNSIITGATSPGISPIDSNTFSKKQAKGTFVRKNPLLQKLLEDKGFNTQEISDIWSSILDKKGSVMHLDFLTLDEKNIFLTAREIDQLELIRQAADRTPFICQGQSLNRWVHPQITPKAFNNLVYTAAKQGVKTTYYTRSAAPEVMVAFEKDAYIITKEGCPYCDKAKDLLKNLGANIKEYDRSELEHFVWKTVPQIWYQGHYIGGYEDLEDFYLQKERKDNSTEQSDPLMHHDILDEMDISSECTSCEG